MGSLLPLRSLLEVILGSQGVSYAQEQRFSINFLSVLTNLVTIMPREPFTFDKFNTGKSYYLTLAGNLRCQPTRLLKLDLTQHIKPSTQEPNIETQSDDQDEASDHDKQVFPTSFPPLLFAFTDSGQ